MFHPFIRRISRPKSPSTHSEGVQDDLKAHPIVSTVTVPSLHVDDTTDDAATFMHPLARMSIGERGESTASLPVEAVGLVARRNPQATVSESTLLLRQQHSYMQKSQKLPTKNATENIDVSNGMVGSPPRSIPPPHSAGAPRRRTRSAISQTGSMSGIISGNFSMLAVPERHSPAHEYDVDDYGFLTDGSISDAGSSSHRRGTPPVSSNHAPRKLSHRLSWFWSESDPATAMLSASIQADHYREQEQRWEEFMRKCPSGLEARGSRRVRRWVRDTGLPPSLRGKIWIYLTGADKEIRAHYPLGYFSELQRRSRINDAYTSIEHDVARTYPNHVQFLASHGGAGQDDLLRVLKAYAHHNPRIGYCQGMGRVAGMLLMHMDAESAFWVLTALTMTENDWLWGLYTDRLEHLRIDSHILSRLIRHYLPRIGVHMEHNDVDPLMFLTPWFLTVYTQALPWPTVLRVWDLFICAGRKILFRVALGLLDLHKDSILEVTGSDVLGVLLHMDHGILEADVVMQAAYKTRLRRSEIEKRRKEVEAEGMRKNGRLSDFGRTDTGDSVTRSLK